MSEEALKRIIMQKVPSEALESISNPGGILGYQPDPKNALEGPTRGVATMEGL